MAGVQSVETGKGEPELRLLSPTSLASKEKRHATEIC